MGVKNKRSRKVLLQILAGLLLFLFLAESALAIPGKLNFQGALTNADGSRLSDGNYSITFSLYDDLTGGNFTWTEDHNLVVQNGVFSVELGSTNAIDASFFAGDCYLGITIAGEDEMTPRQQILSVGYAFQADNLGGQPASVYVQRGATSVVTSEMITDGSITGNDIASSSIGGSQLVDNSITAAKLADGSGSGIDADFLDGHDASYFTAQSTIAALEERIGQLETILAGVVRVNAHLIRFNNMNVQVVNGTGTTGGTVNGTGNLIVGYDTASSGDLKTGSHNIVVGDSHSYSSMGGLVAGNNNEISNIWSSVTGGSDNVANGMLSSISGGTGNIAEGMFASVSGGAFNTASEQSASISGGVSNVAGGTFASVGGGRSNSATGSAASIAGGENNRAEIDHSSVNGGAENVASGQWSSIVGGRDNQTIGNYTSIVGGGGIHRYGNVALSEYSSILGGAWNITGDNTCEKVYNDQTSHWDIVCLSEFDSDPAPDLSVGPISTISGGYKNIAAGHLSSITGGGANTTIAREASVNGGTGNVADQNQSTVIGGSGVFSTSQYSTNAGELSTKILEILGQ